MNLKLIQYRLQLRNTLSKATTDQLKITKEELNREIARRNKQK